ncbi:MAG: hypothetical protein EXQ89_06470 [Rhodospirillaceae bacterium]|nr:hypothetical protein [Rhodospirillaceae bacterium]
MDVTPRIAAAHQIVEGYGPGRFRVSGRTIEGPIIVFPDSVLHWAVDTTNPDFDSLVAAMLSPEAERVDLLLVGCGARILLVPPEQRVRLRQAGIVIEPMDTGAACRTYNVLLAEGRRVAVALLPIA